MWYELAAIAELVLVLIETTLHCAGLPIGGGHGQQIAVLFGGAFILTKISPGCRSVCASAMRWIKKRGAKKTAIKQGNVGDVKN